MATARTYPSPLCATPSQYTFSSIQSRIFMLNSAYDTWQLANSYRLGCLPPNCTDKQMEEFQNFRTVSFFSSKPLNLATHLWVWPVLDVPLYGQASYQGWPAARSLDRLLPRTLPDTDWQAVGPNSRVGTDCSRHLCQLLLRKAWKLKRDRLRLSLQQVQTRIASAPMIKGFCRHGATNSFGILVF